MAAAPLLFLTLMAWDHEEPLMFGIPALFTTACGLAQQVGEMNKS